MNIGDTFLMDHPPGKGKHLILVVEKLSENDESILILVHITTLYGFQGEDHSCVLKEGEHEFLKHNSFVKYSGIFRAFEGYIDTQIGKGIFIPKDPLSAEILKRVHIGAINSPAIPKKYKKIFEKYDYEV